MTNSTSTKTTILDAAADCFARYGSETSSVDDIARQLGATKGMIYHHYRSKGELLSAVLKRSVQLTYDRVSPAHKSGGRPGELFTNMAVAHVKAMIDEFAYHRVVVDNIQTREGASTTPHERKLQKEIRALQRRYETMYRQVIEAGMADGTFHDQSISIALYSVLSLLNSPVFWYQRRKRENDTDRDTIARQVAAMAYGALASSDS